MVETFDVSVRMAGLLLLNNSQISIEEIEALPFIDGRREAYAVAQRLVAGFASTYKVEVASGPWEFDIKIRLVSCNEPHASPRNRIGLQPLNSDLAPA